jgi:phage FluMu protein Com
LLNIINASFITLIKHLCPRCSLINEALIFAIVTKATTNAPLSAVRAFSRYFCSENYFAVSTNVPLFSVSIAMWAGSSGMDRACPAKGPYHTTSIANWADANRGTFEPHIHSDPVYSSHPV